MTSDLRLQTLPAGRQRIPDQVMSKIFQPFSRETDGSKQQGLGLGLYIASEIASAHKGTLEARSDDEATVLTLRLPATALN